MLNRYGNIDYILKMPIQQAINLYNYGVKQKNIELQSIWGVGEETDSPYFEEAEEIKDNRTGEEILKGVEGILNGNI